jgi:hypothetical protein
MAQPRLPPQRAPRQYDNRRPLQGTDWQAHAQDGYHNQPYQDDSYDNRHTDQVNVGGWSEAGYGRRDNYTNPQAYEPSRSHSHRQWGDAPRDYSQPSQGYPPHGQQNQYQYDDRSYRGGTPQPLNSQRGREVNRPPQQQRLGSCESIINGSVNSRS